VLKWCRLVSDVGVAEVRLVNELVVEEKEKYVAIRIN